MTMKKALLLFPFYLLATLLAPLQANSITSDSIATPPTTGIYPVRHPISPYEKVNEYIMSLQFDKASAETQKLMAAAKRKRTPTVELEQVMTICQRGEEGLRGVDQLLVIDSLVINKKELMETFHIPSELGWLTLSEKGDVMQYQTPLNAMVLRPESISTEDGETLQIKRYYMEDGQLVEGTLVEGLDIDGDVNYPFLMPDGQTFYFAARSSEGYGNYDLYVTRYDGETKQFYRAENLGYPYNSYANDYMLVIDEAANLGWFASDRYQPADKVCIYTFIPNSSRHTIDYENSPVEEVRHAAALYPLSAMSLTDTQRQAIANAQQRAKQLATTVHTATEQDFEFILNDTKTCYHLSDFTSAEARKQCGVWLQKSRNLATLTERLQQLREASPSANQQILDLETRIPQLQAEVHNLEKSIRKTELSQP